MLRSFEGSTPDVADSAFVSERAYVVGDVTVGRDASLWPFVCVRGDFEPVRVGAETNVQDFTMLHGADVGDRVTIGHQVTIDDATVAADSLVGIGSTVLQGAEVGSNCIVGAGAVVTPGQTIPDGHVAYGTPAETRPITDDQREYVRWNCEEYLDMADRYRREGGFAARGTGDDEA